MRARRSVTPPHPVNQKTQADINAEWDALAPVRLLQIQSGIDLTYLHVIKPTLLSLCAQRKYRNILDVGCGPGYLTHEFRNLSNSVIGIDPSSVAIAIAETTYSDEHTNFLVTTIEEFSGMETKQFDLIVANMVLMDMLDLPAVIKSICDLSQSSGEFLFSITHPWFWPIYDGYHQKEWFNYKEEIIIESEFKISLNDGTGLISTHIHRPLQAYFEMFKKFGFVLENLIEPMPSLKIEKKYPKKWGYPRYLVGRCKNMI